MTSHVGCYELSRDLLELRVYAPVQGCKTAAAVVQSVDEIWNILCIVSVHCALVVCK